MKRILPIGFLILSFGFSTPDTDRIPVLVDTDANNELDDQHALAYAFFNQDVFDIKGITINATFGGGDTDQQYEEGKRVMQLCKVWNNIPLKKGANRNFEQISAQIGTNDYDGHEAVDFIIQEALKMKGRKLVLIPTGKLTNIALAIKKEPRIMKKIRIVWLGSNYPDPGEYNLENDIGAMNYILDQRVPFEMVVVRYGTPYGSDFVRVTPADITQNMKNRGPQAPPVTGRHGGTFTRFGDYSVDLFSNIKLSGDPPSRALYDLVALAVVKNPAWGHPRILAAPTMQDGRWQERPRNKRHITIWENFDKTSILEDFYRSIKNAGQ